MAYWHMDRARYYASVGDDARALRHLSKFGNTPWNADSAYFQRDTEEGDRVIEQKHQAAEIAGTSRRTKAIPAAEIAATKVTATPKKNETVIDAMCKGTDESKMLCYKRLCSNFREANTTLRKNAETSSAELTKANKEIEKYAETVGKLIKEKNQCEYNKGICTRKLNGQAPTPDESGRSEIERLNGVVESLQAEKARVEAAARESKSKSQGGCSVM
jgi:hypothetical protein